MQCARKFLDRDQLLVARVANFCKVIFGSIPPGQLVEADDYRIALPVDFGGIGSTPTGTGKLCEIEEWA